MRFIVCPGKLFLFMQAFILVNIRMLFGIFLMKL